MTELVPLQEAAKWFVKRPSVSTLWRWCIRGVGRGRTRLEHVRSTGGTLWTSRAAVERFQRRWAEEDAAALRLRRRLGEARRQVAAGGGL